MKIKEQTIVGRILAFCGRNSLVIMCTHWYVMKSCTYLCSNIYLAILLSVVLSIVIVPIFNNRFTKFLFEVK